MQHTRRWFLGEGGEWEERDKQSPVSSLAASQPAAACARLGVEIRGTGDPAGAAGEIRVGESCRGEWEGCWGAVHGGEAEE